VLTASSRCAIAVALTLGASASGSAQNLTSSTNPSPVRPGSVSRSKISEPEPACPVYLHLDLRTELPPRAVEVFSQEVSLIWEPYDVPFVWQSDPVGAQLPYSVRLNVVIGDAPVSGVRQSSIRKVVGSTVFFDSGLPQDTVYASASTTWEMIRRAHYRDEPVDTLPRTLRQMLLGQALGRVVAHELGHVLLSSAAHTRTGLMRAVFAAGDLVGTRLRFQLEAPERDQIRMVGHCRAVTAAAQ
jgi:hypothetical protein